MTCRSVLHGYFLWNSSTAAGGGGTAVAEKMGVNKMKRRGLMFIMDWKAVVA